MWINELTEPNFVLQSYWLKFAPVEQCTNSTMAFATFIGLNRDPVTIYLNNDHCHIFTFGPAWLITAATGSSGSYWHQFIYWQLLVAVEAVTAVALWDPSQMISYQPDFRALGFFGWFVATILGFPNNRNRKLTPQICRSAHQNVAQWI